MTKSKTLYGCNACGAEHNRWQGQCSQCKQWNTLQLVKSPGQPNKDHSGFQLHNQSKAAHLLSETDLPGFTRIATFSPELDHTLGGGLMPGAVVLLGGQPGAGKSTLLLQILCHLANQSVNQHKVLYVTGEESAQQVALRAHRLNLVGNQVNIFVNSYIDAIISEIERISPQIIVVDSIQVMYHPEVNSSAGSVSQVKECTTALTQLAKARQCIMLLVGHVTKEGALAGPKVLEHIVDTSLLLETNTDQRYRTLRAVKNRYGAVNELSVFAMGNKGMKPVNNPSAIFLSQNTEEAVSGRAVTVIWEGTRPLLVEIQALVDNSHTSNPKRVSVGFDYNRLAMLLAVLHRHGGLQLGNYDIFTNLVGGIKITETGADLSLLLAILSSYKDKPVDQRIIVFGELGLSGEIRPVPYGQERLAEAKKHGFKQAIIPAGNKPTKPWTDMQIHAVSKLGEAIDLLG